MFNIIFYEDKNGKCELQMYLIELKRKADNGNKNARINLNKIVAYIDMLEEMGTRIGEPITKHLYGEIWELRPLEIGYYMHITRMTHLFYYIILKRKQEKHLREN